MNLFPRSCLQTNPYRFRTRTIPNQGRGNVKSSVIWLSTDTVEYGSETSSEKRCIITGRIILLISKKHLLSSLKETIKIE